MSAKAKARKPRTATAKPAAETIPLAGVSITIARPRIFATDKETVTFDGDRLAAALRWVALACPNLDQFTSAEGVAIELAGIAQTCRGLGDAEDIDYRAVFHSLYCRLDDLASRINAGEHNYTKMEALTITRKPAAVSSSAEPDAARKVAAYDAAQKIVDAVKEAGKGKVAR